MILFPFAVIWLVAVVVWAIRRSRQQPVEPPRGEEWRRRPRRPRNGPHGRPSRGGTAARARTARRIDRV